MRRDVNRRRVGPAIFRLESLSTLYNRRAAERVRQPAGDAVRTGAGEIAARQGLLADAKNAFKLVAEMVEQGSAGSVVTLFCDPGDRYLDKYYSDDWLREQGLDIAPYTDTIDRFLATGAWPV